MSSSTAAEFRRLVALYALGLLDTEPEPEYDGIVKVAAYIAKCPMAVISLVDVDRLWFKAAKGLAVRQTSRDYSFCSDLFKGEAPLIVPDATVDPRFNQSPLVTGAPGVRFYLGFPVVFGGERLGALCVLDRVPRELSEEQISMLSELAGTVSALFESRQRFQAMGERDQLLEKLSEEVPGVIYQFRRNVDGKYSMPFATSRLPELVGVRPEEVRHDAARVFDAIHPEDLPRVLESIERSARTLETWRGEYRVCIPGYPAGWREGHATPERSPDGSVLWHGYVSDISERKLAEAALQRSQQQAALAISTAGLGIAIWNAAGTEVFYDAMTARHYGRTDQIGGSIRTEEWLQLLVESDRTNVEQTLRGVVQGLEPRFLTFRVVRPDGRMAYLEGHLQPVFDAYTKQLQILGITRDVTDRHEAEQAKLLATAAEQSNLAKTQFLGRVSHELRTPLNAILGFAQILARSEVIRADPSAREQVSRVTMAGWQLLELINDLLQLTEAETARDRILLEPVKVEPVIDKVIALLDGLAHSREVTVRKVGEDWKDVSVVADKRRLEQCLINLLSNAIKYNSERGEVKLELSHLAGQVAFCVSDTGVGLTVEQLSELGQPFSRLGAEFSGIEGSGLGLAITRNLVERMGGSLRMHSEIGVGSSFSILLNSAQSIPDDDGRQADEAGRSEVPPDLEFEIQAAIGEPRVVLYVEDNTLNRMVMHGLFEQRPGWQLLLAANGRECMEILASATPDLILLDMHLPDCTGLELFARMMQHEHLAQLPVVAISADALPEKVSAARAAGFHDYWVKPVDLNNVHSFLTELATSRARDSLQTRHRVRSATG